jgi:CRISPR system Cascade subunit CasE
MDYLSQVLLSKRDAATRRLRDAYDWHRAIWQAFPNRDGEERHFLFRVDDKREYFRAFVLSLEEPCAPSWGEWESKPVSASFLQHDRYRFQLKANPTMRRKTDRRRLGLFKADLLCAWMQRKAETAGFELVDGTLVVGLPVEERFFREGKVGKHISVDFQGVLRVTDRFLFRQAFEQGIGSAKAFGFGLLMLQPI